MKCSIADALQKEEPRQEDACFRERNDSPEEMELDLVGHVGLMPLLLLCEKLHQDDVLRLHCPTACGVISGYACLKRERLLVPTRAPTKVQNKSAAA